MAATSHKLSSDQERLRSNSKLVWKQGLYDSGSNSSTIRITSQEQCSLNALLKVSVLRYQELHAVGDVWENESSLWEVFPHSETRAVFGGEDGERTGNCLVCRHGYHSPHQRSQLYPLIVDSLQVIAGGLIQALVPSPLMRSAAVATQDS
ncbi:hypothetical protein H920_12738 [Fukomys damarensis]|uniref:Uncharacterized protein n=1 Tax=Fukomys damarensis TaxID=885580 RepID=A0A091D6F0_FUKDA|nr:hypothetical protein H920_12738 [Fukomys damarensis]